MSVLDVSSRFTELRMYFQKGDAVRAVDFSGVVQELTVLQRHEDEGRLSTVTLMLLTVPVLMSKPWLISPLIEGKCSERTD